jgi:hypothetical protein
MKFSVPSIVLLLLAGVAFDPARAATPSNATRILVSPAGPNSGQASLSAAPDGALWMSWVERGPGGGRRLRVARVSDRAPVARTVAGADSLVVNGASFPALAALGGNRIAVAWGVQRDDLIAQELRAATSPDGGRTWSRPARLHRDQTPTEHGFVRVVREGDGARAVWLDGRNGAGKEEGAFDMTVRTATIDARGRVSQDQLVDPRACDCCPLGAVAVSGASLVAWRDRTAEEIRDISTARIAPDGPGEVTPVHRDGWRMPGCPVNGPALAAGGGRVAAAWYTVAGDTARVRCAFSADGGRTYAEPVRVNEGDPVGRVDIAMLADGSAAVSWLEHHGEGVRLRARRVTPGGVSAPAITVASLTGLKGVGLPRVARLGTQLVVAWTEPGAAPRVRLKAVTLP